MYIKNIYREEMDDLSVESLISYLKTVFESWISSFFRFFMVKLLFEILKLPSKTAALSSKMQIAVQKSYIGLICNEEILTKRKKNSSKKVIVVETQNLLTANLPSRLHGLPPGEN